MMKKMPKRIPAGHAVTIHLAPDEFELVHVPRHCNKARASEVVPES